MFSFVWSLATLPFTVVGLVFKLGMLAIIVGLGVLIYFGGEYVGWDNVRTFMSRVFDGGGK